MTKSKEPGIGHNSSKKTKKGGSSGDIMRTLVAHVEALSREKDDILADISEVYAEAKGHGFDTKIMRRLIAQRKRDKKDVEAEEALLALYAHTMSDEEDEE